MSAGLSGARRSDTVGASRGEEADRNPGVEKDGGRARDAVVDKVGLASPGDSAVAIDVAFRTRVAGVLIAGGDGLGGAADIDIRLSPASAVGFGAIGGGAGLTATGGFVPSRGRGRGLVGEGDRIGVRNGEAGGGSDASLGLSAAGVGLADGDAAASFLPNGDASAGFVRLGFGLDSGLAGPVSLSLDEAAAQSAATDVTLPPLPPRAERMS